MCNIVAELCGNPMSCNDMHSHTASFAAFNNAIYLASTEDRATVSCFFEDYKTALPVMSNTKPPTEC
jgi:hypothetical protein